MQMITMLTLIHGAKPDEALAVQKASRICFVRMGDVESLIAGLEEGVPAGYIAGHRFDQELRTLVNRVRAAVPDAHLVIGLEDASPARGVTRIECNRLTWVTPIPAEVGLHRATTSTWFEARRRYLYRRLQDSDFGWLVRRALRRTLEQNLRPGRPPMHTIEKVAAECGTDRAGLARARRHRNLNLARFIFLWVLALALRERFIPDDDIPVSWLTVARRCGYTGLPGLTGLLVRELGHGLRKATLQDLWNVFDRLEQLLAGIDKEEVNVS